MSLIGNPLLANDERVKKALNRIADEERKHFEDIEDFTDIHEEAMSSQTLNEL